MATTVESSFEGTSPRSTILGAPPSPPTATVKVTTKTMTDETANSVVDKPTDNADANNNNNNNNNNSNSTNNNNNNNNNTEKNGNHTVNHNHNNNTGEGPPSNGNNPNVVTVTTNVGPTGGHPHGNVNVPTDQFYATAADQGYGHAAAAAFFPQANGNNTTTTTTTTGTNNAFAAPGANPFAGASPLSPPRAATVVTPGVAATAGVPPASPLFPRLNQTNNGVAAGPTDVNQDPAFGGYAGGPSYSNVAAQLNSPVPTSAEEAGSWPGNSQQPGASPQVHSQQQASPAIPMPYGITAATSRAASGGRAYSFESDSMLPPAAVDAVGEHGTPNPAYSPYGGSTASSTAQTTPTLFAGAAAGQQWGYGGAAVPDMYGATPASPLQPRPAHHMAPHMGYPPPPHHHAPPHLMAAATGGLGMRPMPNHMGGGYGAAGGHHQFFPTSSPGPPIQTTASNKGPDGANLFIFHIPNHFTNLDMYQLFEPYGNLLSVRIMVEKDSGRSRGFGFVSYDSPESAALAIKALNGFAIGNKRLKVQHKQIRPKDMHGSDRVDNGGYGVDMGLNHNNYGNHPPHAGHMMGAPQLPPAGPGGWAPRSPQPQGVEGKPPGGDDQATELTSATSTGGDTPLGLTGTPGPGAEHGLDSLGSLQNALPDVGGGGAPGTGNSE